MTSGWPIIVGKSRQKLKAASHAHSQDQREMSRTHAACLLGAQLAISALIQSRTQSLGMTPPMRGLVILHELRLKTNLI